MNVIAVLLVIAMVIAPSAYADITYGLVGWWKLDEATGVNVVDSSGSNNTGTVVNNPISVTGKKNLALSFNGSNQCISISVPTFLSGSSKVSISAWVYATALANGPDYNSQKHLIDLKDGAYLIEENYQQWAFGVYTSTYFEAISNNSYVANTWVFLAGTYDGSNLKLYVNGTLSATTAVSGPISLVASAEARIASSGSSSPNRFLQGYLDDVRVYNRALSAAEVKEIYDGKGHVVIGGRARLSGFHVK